ncbi:MAG TPA: hypothetical protein VM049_01160 [Gaiellaceae bacterium]|nr:hypothetical protein [Gaiellaceae bacterium]
MDAEPTDDELHAFVASMLSNLDKILREPAVIEDAIREHREMWVKIYRSGLEFDQPEASA